MKFGRIANFATVDYTLPPDASATTQVLAKLPARMTLPELYVGCTGWSMKEWLGHVYPKGTKTPDYLKYYAQQFNTIELNTTHYRIPSVEIVSKWREQSSPDFRFCPKIPQSISHTQNLGINTGLIEQFCENISFLEEKMGCCFMQLPPYFEVDKLYLLEQFLRVFPKNIPLAIEVRHESWYRNTKAQESFFQLLEKHGIHSVITDVPGRRDVLHQRLTSDTVLLRWNGNGLHDTDYERMNKWLDRIGTWFTKNLKKVYLFVHEPDNILGPDMALYTVNKAKEMYDIVSRGPSFYDRDQGEQMSLF